MQCDKVQLICGKEQLCDSRQYVKNGYFSIRYLCKLSIKYPWEDKR